ncbi:MAG: hypothetical protein HQL84_04375 [Magnetococcales bacterium]|nr:hypothetical protein [Magnetococcales bacterium]MBF0149264.1 hypothetical protein [Magnetococcales bacterium]MBF0172797.1 hypothetical protein [Magnetococcales bacterium]MBF0348007.1 hypothetical protein [Magnetococcales bacterium]
MSLAQTIVWLESILKRLEAPRELTPEELETLTRDWLAATARLDDLSEQEMRKAVAADPFLKPRLQRLVEQLPLISADLGAFKSEVASELMAQNRRLQSVRRGYGRAANPLVLVRYQA